MRGKWFVISASVVLLALAGAGTALLLRVPATKANPQTPAPQPPPVDTGIPLSGKIQAQHVVGVPPPLEGAIGAFFVEVGQEVFEGQLLARLTNESLETGQESAQKILESAQERVNTLESEVVAARLEASRARADSSRARTEFDRLDRAYRRQQMLYNEGATPKLTYEKSGREFELAQTEFRNHEEVAKQAESHVAELIRNLDAEKRALDQKSAELESAKTKASATELVSPVQGLVVGRNGEVGQSVAPDKTDFFQIATQLSQLEVVLDPDPVAMRRIQPGQPALVNLPDQGVDGMLGAVKAIQGAQVVVAFTSPNPVVRPGMTAQVRIKAP